MFERRTKPLLPRRLFYLRLAKHLCVALAVVLGSWLAGILGYRELEGLSWIDAMLNAAMILGGMGPVNELHTDAGKIFAAIYALYSGMVFLAVTGITLAPFVPPAAHVSP